MEVIRLTVLARNHIPQFPIFLAFHALHEYFHQFRNFIVVEGYLHIFGSNGHIKLKG